jgi:molybdopterin-guanine dinucleotide biosynthesis protein A
VSGHKTATPVSCIILAGGKGLRAGGVDKGLIPYKDKPLIQHVIDRIGDQTDEIIISANRNLNIYGQYTDKVITDSFDHYKGPLAGIASCMSHCQYEWSLVTACDMPSLPDDLVARLREKSQNKSICIATLNNRHQLAFLVKNDLSASITAQINNNQLKLIQWIESIPHATVSFDDNPDAFLNLNTITDKN